MRTHSPFSYLAVILTLTTVAMNDRAAAQSTEDEHQKDAKPVNVQWKFAEGETLFYEQRQETTHRKSIGDLQLDATDRRYFLYRWDVLVDEGPTTPNNSSTSMVLVSFGRVLRELVTPNQAIRADTYAPIGASRLSTKAEQMQDEVFGMLRSNFVFFATPTGATALPSEIAGSDLPPEMQVPPTIQSPKSFTPGDSVGFPEFPIAVGDSWTIPVDSNGMTGIGTYQFVGERNRNGRPCLLIEGETSYHKLPEYPDPDELAAIQAGPRKSTYYFDAELGRLIEGEEVLPIEMTFVDGHTRSMLIRTTRKLIEQPKEPQPIELTRKLANGKVVKFWFQGGRPMNAKGDWADVGGSGLSIAVAPQSDGSVRLDKLVWSVILEPKPNQRIDTVTVYDVTVDKPVLMVEASQPRATDGKIFLPLKETDISESLPAWIKDHEIEERIFEIVLRDDRGETEVLHQPVVILTGNLIEHIKQIYQQSKDRNE